jgi:hypothetical protein
MEAWERGEMLDAMSFAAFKEAADQRSEEGKEVLRMLEAATTTTWGLPAEEAAAVAQRGSGLDPDGISAPP